MGNIERDDFEERLKNAVIRQPGRGLAVYGDLFTSFGTMLVDVSSFKLGDRLNGGGVVISNHPFSLDLSVVTKLLTNSNGTVRRDLKFLVSEKTYDFYAKYFGPAHFVATTTEPRKLVDIFKAQASFVNNGGLFVMFPTKRNGKTEAENLAFESGFGYLLGLTRPDVEIASVSLNYAKDRATVKVFSDLKKAFYWQAILDRNISNLENNALLAKEYEKLHYFNLAK